MKDTGDVIFEEEPYNGIRIKAASIDKLIEECLKNFDVDQSNEETERLAYVFFHTYHWYLSTDELICKFDEIYDKALKTGKYQLEQIENAVRYWLSHFGCDFQKNGNALNILNTLNSKVLVNQRNGTIPAELNLEEWHQRRKAGKRPYLNDDMRRPSLNFDELPAVDICKQLVHLCWKGVKKIPVYEWMKYGKTAKTKDTPLLKDQICLFNDVSKYVVAMILNRESAADRANSVSKFIAMSKCLLELKDYNTLLAVIGGMGHSAITRLQKTKDLLSNADKLFFKETNELLTSSLNYSKYRNKVAGHKGFVMPILGVIMKDLVALETAIKDHVEHNDKKLVNFHKMVQVSDILHKITGLRDTPPEVDPDKELSNIMRLSLKSRYSEDDLYELSAQREPRSVHKQSIVTTIESPVFAEWAAGITPETPDRATVEKYILNMVDAVFKTYDVDRNGSINKDEFDQLATNFPFIDNFAVLDVNCDGDISRQEMLNYFMNANAQEMTKEFLHDFQEHSFYSPTYCVYCMGFLWGIGKSGYRCKVCQIVCHKDCKNHVVMECRPQRSFSLRDPKTKSFKKRHDSSWQGSTDSVTNESLDSTTISRFSDSSVDFSDALIIERLKERITRLEVEKIDMKKENTTLKTKLSSAEKQIESLQSQLEQIRPLSVKFMLDQLERLSTCKETDL